MLHIMFASNMCAGGVRTTNVGVRMTNTIVIAERKTDQAASAHCRLYNVLALRPRGVAYYMLPFLALRFVFFGFLIPYSHWLPMENRSPAGLASSLRFLGWD